MKIATYNIPRCIGGDGRREPRRIVEVMRELDADIIALQEVESSAEARFDMLGYLAAAMGMSPIAGPTLAQHNGHYGNALLTRCAVLEKKNIDLSVTGHEPRGAIEALLRWERHALRVVATHLGLWPGERRRQVRQLLRLFALEDDSPAILLGDLNEWFLWGRPLRWLHAHFQASPAPRSFPARWPLFALDRIWVHPRGALQKLVVHNSPLARIASDHLPLIAEIAPPAEDSAHG